jgi:YD repeat-containing protein
MTLHTYKFDDAGRVIHDKTDDLEWFYKYDDDDNLIAYQQMNCRPGFSWWDHSDYIKETFHPDYIKETFKDQ